MIGFHQVIFFITHVCTVRFSSIRSFFFSIYAFNKCGLRCYYVPISVLFAKNEKFIVFILKYSKMWSSLCLPALCRCAVFECIGLGSWGVSVQWKQSYTVPHHRGNTRTLRKCLEQVYFAQASAIVTIALHSNDFGPVSLPSWAFWRQAVSYWPLGSHCLAWCQPERRHLDYVWWTDEASMAVMGGNPAVRVSDSRVLYSYHMYCLIGNAFCQDNCPWGANEERLWQFLRQIL